MFNLAMMGNYAGSCACVIIWAVDVLFAVRVKATLESKRMLVAVVPLLLSSCIERLNGAALSKTRCLLHGLLLVLHRLSALVSQAFAPSGTHLLVVRAVAVVVVVVRPIGKHPGDRNVGACSLRHLLNGRNVQLRRVIKHCGDIHGRRGCCCHQRGRVAYSRWLCCHLTAAVLVGHVSSVMRLDGLSRDAFRGAANGVFALYSAQGGRRSRY